MHENRYSNKHELCIRHIIIDKEMAHNPRTTKSPTQCSKASRPSNITNYNSISFTTISHKLHSANPNTLQLPFFVDSHISMHI